MAERRMFAKTIIDSDAFLDMPMSTRLLYYDLGMRGDDDGFVNSPKKIMRITGASDDDFRLLIGRKFIIPFESGVVVIKHWKIHNYIRSDRYSETKYKDEKALLTLDENNAYRFTGIPNGIPPVGDWDTQDRLGKDRLGKVRLERGEDFIPPSLDELKIYHAERKMTFDVQKFFDYFTEGDWIDSKGNEVRNWKQKMLSWQNKEKLSTPQQKKRYTIEKETTYSEEELEAKLLKKGKEDIPC